MKLQTEQMEELRCRLEATNISGRPTETINKTDTTEVNNTDTTETNEDGTSEDNNVDTT